MTIKEIKAIVTEHPYNFSVKIKNADPKLYAEIDMIDGKKFSEKLYVYLHGETICSWRECNNRATFQSFQVGFKDHCSRTCCNKNKEVAKKLYECKYCNKQFEYYASQNREFCSLDCYNIYRKENDDYDHIILSARDKLHSMHGTTGWGIASIKKKGMKTKLERYGTTGYNNRSKERNTKLERYGDPYYNNRPKANDTVIERYGSWNNINDSVSNQEKELVEFIQSIYTGEIIESDRKILGGLEIDILLPELNIGIEFDGLYWHSEITGNKTRSYHLNKTKLAESKSIHLIHIFEDEWLYSKNITKSKLQHIIGVSNTNRIFARKCSVQQLTPRQYKDFNELNHIQGHARSRIKYGLYYNDELVSVIGFSSYRSSMGKSSVENEYELIRYATSTHVIGGFSKLLKHFIREHHPNKIISYADRRYTSKHSNVYEVSGFKLVKETDPNYWYIVNGKREYRYRYRKSELSKLLEIFDNDLTEWENMQANGYDRIWDCGNLKFEIIP